MPSKHLHQKKQSRTLLALSDLQASQNRSHHADWIVTLAFYKALHAVDSYLADKCKIHPSNHVDRHKHVQRHLGFIHGEYSALYYASMKARYEGTYENDPQEVKKLLNLSLHIENRLNEVSSLTEK